MWPDAPLMTGHPLPLSLHRPAWPTARSCHPPSLASGLSCQKSDYKEIKGTQSGARGHSQDLRHPVILTRLSHTYLRPGRCPGRGLSVAAAGRGSLPCKEKINKEQAEAGRGALGACRCTDKRRELWATGWGAHSSAVDGGRGGLPPSTRQTPLPPPPLILPFLLSSRQILTELQAGTERAGREGQPHPAFEKPPGSKES